jgi:hypothetical protein
MLALAAPCVAFDWPKACVKNSWGCNRVQCNFISLIETGQIQPTISTIFKLARALKIKTSKLVATAEKLASYTPQT